MNKLLYILSAAIVVVSCNNHYQNNDSVVFTTNFSMDPSEPRFGIEIKSDTIFYCEEIIGNKGNYNYYYCNYDKDKIKSIHQEVLKQFSVGYKKNEISDGMLCQLNIVNGEDSSKYVFFESNLNVGQRKIINNIIILKNCNLKNMEYHSFPEEMLKDKLPEPPPI